MYELYDDCSADNLASLAIIYYKLAALATDIEIRQVYVERVIECYEESIKKNAVKANNKYKDSQIDMSEAVRRYIQMLPKYKIK